ncbi:MAG TPA: TolC family protein, partial [Steroidobacter sp.]|nr:TolC family protein [Steroidobacter sp.]
MRRIVLIACVCVASVAHVQAQDERPFEEVVAGYVSEGLRSNLSLQSESLQVEQAAQALAAARSRFFPEVALQARYTRAEGGREFVLPFGAALNPVYSTLNEMLSEQGRPAQFSRMSDATVRFMREGEQDTRIVARQVLYAPAIPAAVRAQRALLDASNFNRMALARALRRDITIAYVDWLKARHSVEIVAASEALLRENLRVNTALFENGKITEDQVLRARAELLAVEQQKREIDNLSRQAQSFFNFLLNRELTAEIEPSFPPAGPSAGEAALEQLWAAALDRRPEVNRVERLRRASEEQVRIARQQLWPTLSLAVDGGVQGEDYRAGDGYSFTTASLVFAWRLFDGGGDRARVRQAQAAERQLVLRREELAQQIRLEVQQAYDRLITAR